MTSQFVFGVDLDGVVADYTVGFAEIVAEMRGIDPASLPDERSYDFREWGLSPDEFERYHATAVTEHRMLAKLPAIEGAAEALWRLSDAGVWIRVITHRLYVNWGHAEAVGDTVQWLDAERIPYRDICFLGNKPEVEADCYVDDAPHNIAALRAGGNDVIVFDQPYNRDAADPRARDWRAVEQLVMDRFTEWRGAAGVQPQLPGIDAGKDRLAERRSASGAAPPPAEQES
ncbi:MAG: hypothetical protein F4Z00_01395 [Acidimicrobiaceae bacterium]|nr:hypothetical protein [Acidimicrobiaceae bacterium]MCY3643294.1 hypothetical protein [Acidimicrobiaceae bacterium]MXY11436.1 hypothetical protein [Acidimicrobiaceae bacterium]MXZ64193.1 hypothetical protein [Acidimicrobiaceae bacterium]MYA14392.1 hypothetical protein [Acidimicrobiaceae bacterium]